MNFDSKSDAELGKIVREQLENGYQFKIVSPKKKESNKKYAKSSTEQYLKTEKSEGFTFYFYQDYGNPLINSFKYPDLARIFYLSTFLYYDGYLKFNNQYNIDKENIKDKINLSNNRFKDFFDMILNRNIIYKKDDLFYLNSNLFFKGGLEKSIIKDSKFIKVFNKPMRILYEDDKISDSSLGILLKLIPYIDFRTNYLCRNPSRSETEEIDLLNIQEIADILSYSRAGVKNALDKLTDKKIFKDEVVKYDNIKSKGRSIAVQISKYLLDRQYI